MSARKLNPLAVPSANVASVAAALERAGAAHKERWREGLSSEEQAALAREYVPYVARKVVVAGKQQAPGTDIEVLAVGTVAAVADAQLTRSRGRAFRLTECQKVAGQLPLQAKPVELDRVAEHEPHPGIQLVGAAGLQRLAVGDDHLVRRYGHRRLRQLARLDHCPRHLDRAGEVDAGAGQLTKMANQICIAGIVQGISEALYFADRAGLDAKAVAALVSQGAGGSWQLANRAETMVDGKFDFGFAVDWMRKDLGIVLDEAKSNGARLPVTALVDQFYGEVQDMGGGRWDTSSLLRRLTR